MLRKNRCIKLLINLTLNVSQNPKKPLHQRGKKNLNRKFLDATSLVAGTLFRVFVNLRHEHVIATTHFAASPNREAGVCACGRGLLVLLRKCRWTGVFH